MKEYEYRDIQVSANGFLLLHLYASSIPDRFFEMAFAIAFSIHAFGVIYTELSRKNLMNAFSLSFSALVITLFFGLEFSKALLPCACSVWQGVGLLVKIDLLDYCTRKYQKKIYWFKLRLEDKLQYLLSFLCYLIFILRASASFGKNYFYKLVLTSHVAAFLYLVGKLDFKS